MGSRRALATAVLALASAVGAVAACGDGEGAPATVAPPGEAGNVEGPTPLCVDGEPTMAYPPSPYELTILGTVRPGMSFEGLDGAIALDGFFDPCAARPRLLVVRSGAAWCGPCIWHAEHTKDWLEDPALADRLIFVDLLIADEDNMPATASALSRWRETVDAPSAVLGVDASFVFRRALLSRAPLPTYVLIDTRSMTIVTTLEDPDPERLRGRLMGAIADLDGALRPAPTRPTLVDGYFTVNEMDLIRGMSLAKLGAPPVDPTNEYGDVPAAAAFGEVLFNDALLSPSGGVSCATCHDPAKDLTDGVPQAVGVGTGNRNSPAIALAAHSRWQFWDGRADTLWMQALGPFEDPLELGASRLFVAQQIAQRHGAQYDEVFGATYPLPDLTALPAHGKPGAPAYDALSAADKEKVTRVFVNVGKAIAAFERTIRVKPNALDRYADGDTAALTERQKQALSAFFVSGCAQCHWGPRLTNDAFHVIRFPTGRQDGDPDTGRQDGLLALSASEFRASSTWSDAPSAAKPFIVDAPTMLGAFKTPSLRGLPTSAPYGHGGTLKTLAEVTDHYGKRGLEHGDPGAVGTTEQWVPEFDSKVAEELPAILEVMTGSIKLP